MDDSIIKIDDSIVTIESDTDVEEGEVKEIDDEDVNITANLQQPLSCGANHQTAIKDETLIFEVLFRNRDDYNRLQERLLKALNVTFASEQFVYTTKETSISAHTLVKSPEPKTDIFMIDTSPTHGLNAAQIPSYKRYHSEVLDEETSARKKLRLDEVNKCSRPKPQSACYNCGDTDHSLRDCKRPRNHARIRRARKKRVERYHVDTEQRFAHIRPGRISSKTRHAMGFSRSELPFIFYRMRVLGYPPAWLEDAKVQSSGITVFNAEGTEVRAPEQEEGESESFKYDVNKIIDFPGFNVEPGPKFFDDFQHHNVPCFQEHQLKANFIKSLGENVIKGYKRKKLNLPEPHDACEIAEYEDRNLVEHDMDLDDDSSKEHEFAQPSLPIDDSNSAVPSPPTNEVETIRSPSPTLEDLRAQQAELIQQLESNTSQNTSEIASKVSQTQSVQHTPSKTGAASAQETTPKTESILVPDTSESPGHASIFKAPSIAGTPILKFSEYDKLPVGEKFKVGVSDVINFENLPDSTGKYQQMKRLLKNVRRKMEELQNEDD